jgi:hypothetical protein
MARGIGFAFGLGLVIFGLVSLGHALGRDAVLARYVECRALASIDTCVKHLKLEK